MFTTDPGLDFAFPTDPNAGTQAAPFADLLLGNKQVVTQGIQPREADGKLFQYAGGQVSTSPGLCRLTSPDPQSSNG